MTTEATYNYPYRANNHVEIDQPTGLPKLSIELLPDTEPDEYRQYGLAARNHSLWDPYIHPVDMAGKVSKVCVGNAAMCQDMCHLAAYCTGKFV